jgi:hypothetical protein
MGVGMSQGEYRMVYALERGGRTVYCSSFAVVSVLIAMGWTMSDSGHWAGWISPATQDPSEQSPSAAETNGP